MKYPGYDNYTHNVAMFGVEISLYDLFADRNKKVTGQDLQHRLFEPIDHNFAAIGSGNVIPTAGGPERGNPDIDPYGPNMPYGPTQAMPINDQSWLPLESPWQGHRTPERTNVWFFNGGNNGLTDGEFGYINNGTYEHPFDKNEFYQGILDAISRDTIKNNLYPQAYLYFTKGTYNPYASQNNSSSIPLEIQIRPGESIWGRTGDHNGFGEPATGNDRPVFIGGFQLDSNTGLNDVMLQNFQNPKTGMPAFDQAIFMNGATNVSINDSQIGVGAAGNAGYHIGIYMQNNSSITINGSDIYGYNSGSGKYDAGIGIYAVDAGDISVKNKSLIEGIDPNAEGIGLEAGEVSGNTKVGNITGDRTSTFKGTGERGYGFVNSNPGTKSVTIGNISGVNFEGEGTSGNGYGFEVSTDGPVKIGISDGILNSNFTGVGKSGYGFFVSSKGSTISQIGNIFGSTFTGMGFDGKGIGFSAKTDAALNIGNISGSTFTGIGGAMKGDGIGFSAETAALNIGNISDNSMFTGQSMSGDTGYGFLVSADGPVEIGISDGGGISNSTFTGNSYAGDGFGFYVNGHNSDVNIGEIQSSTFKGISTASDGGGSTGFYAIGNTVKISAITGDTFEATALKDSSASLNGLTLGGDVNKVGTTAYISGKVLYDALKDNNRFTLTGGDIKLKYHVCILGDGKNSCY